MWIICLSSEQSGDKELVQRISRSLIQVCKDRPVLLIRLAHSADQILNPLETRARGRMLSSQLNEAGIAVINVEGTDRDLLNLNKDGALTSESIKWLRKLLRQGVVVSLSLLANKENEVVNTDVSSFMTLFKKADLGVEALIFIHKEQKRRLLVQKEPVSTIKLGHSALNNRVLDENILQVLADLSEYNAYITSPIALLSKSLDKSTQILFS